MEKEFEQRQKIERQIVRTASTLMLAILRLTMTKKWGRITRKGWRQGKK